MKKNILAAKAIVGGIALIGWGAGQANEAELREQEQRVQVLAEDDPAVSPIRFGGLVEVGYSSVEDFDGNTTSDVVLATVELSAEAHINDWTHAELVLLFEEDDTEPMEVDVGVLNIANPEASPFYLSAGRMYVPFGNFESNMVSDPLTLELGETRESALLVGYDSGRFYGAAYLFNGDVEDGGDDRADDFGVSGGAMLEGTIYSLAVGASYLGNLAESDTLQDTDNTAASGTLADSIEDAVSGVALHAIYNYGPYTVIGEYVAATDEFEPSELAFDGQGAKPSAWNIEAGYAFELMGREAFFALGHQRTSEALAVGLPESKSLATISVEVLDNTAVSLEYAQADDYGTAEGGSGGTERAFTLQLAAEF